jgi:hypothetical protein
MLDFLFNYQETSMSKPITTTKPTTDAFEPSAIAAAVNTVGTQELDLTQLALTNGQNFGQLAAVKRVITTIPARKPNGQQFVRTRPGAEWQLQALTLSLKDDGEVYFVHPDLYGELSEEVRPKMLYVYVTRDGSLGLWPVNLPSEDGRLDTWSQSAHTAAKMAQDAWIRLVSNRTVGAYEVRQAVALTDEPVWPDLTMREILNLAFRDKLITSLEHPIVKSLRGAV